MDQAEAVTVTEPTPPAMEYAGFWARFFSSVLDSLLQAVILAPILIWTFGLDALMDPAFDRGAFDFWSNLTVVAVILLFWKFKSATPGKIMMGLQIVDAETLGPVPFGRLVLRLLGYVVSVIPLCLGFFWIAWDKRKQGFHDKIAKTVVIRLP
jgi:uncharacterized RDD family membrane protein YckC